MVVFLEVLLEIKNLEIDNILNKIDLTFFKGVNVFLCGVSASGKTTLLKAINKEIEYKGDIKKYGNILVVYDNYLSFNKRIDEELDYKNLEEREKKLVRDIFGKKELKSSASNFDRRVILVLKSLFKKSDLIFFDNLFSFINKDILDLIISYIKERGITIVDVSTNIENVLNYDYMIVMDKGMIAIEGKMEQVIEEEKLLKRLGIGLPFIVDLSLQLKSYGLIDKIYKNKEDLVGALWK